MSKKIISILMCLCLIFCSSVTVFAESVYPKTVSEFVRVTDGVGELISQFFNLISLRTKYPDSRHLCEIPDIDKGYVPQGFCYIDSMNMYAVSSYSDGDDNSIVSLIDAKSGERIKTVYLVYEDGGPCYAHVGGVCDIGDSLIVSTGKGVRRLKLDTIEKTDDYGYAKFSGRLATDMQASYVCSYGTTLFVGQFYCFTPGNTYETPAEQRIYLPNGKRNYAMCEQFDLSDLDKVFKAGKATPELVISMPNSVQGISFDGETFVTSASYSANGPSKIRYYNLEKTDAVFNMNGTDVPLVYLDEARAIRTVKVPPMVEGIDWCNGKICGIFESGAKKFKSSRVRTPFICEFN